MSRLFASFKMFFAVLFGRVPLEACQKLLGPPEKEAAAPTPTPTQKAATPSPKPSRSDAITLLSMLQREARFVDLVQEPLGDYSDEQIGAAARGVLSDCGATLERVFQLQPVVEDQENAEVETPADFSASRYRLTGNVSGDPPFRGRLVHHGWMASKCELPSWSGDEDASTVVAPAEIEL
jgi:hypothetical protein